MTSNKTSSTSVQPKPSPNDLPACWDLVIADMQARDEFGALKYKTRLQPLNGRDALTDLSQELLDGLVYAKQLEWELLYLGKQLRIIYDMLVDESAHEDLSDAATLLKKMIDTNPVLGTK